MVAATQKIKSGYKRTDAGEIPSEWGVITYGDAFSFLRTTAYSRDQLSNDGDIGYVHYGDIHTRWNHSLDLDKETLPTVDSTRAGAYTYAQDGDLIMVDASEDNAGLAKSAELKNVKGRKLIAGLHTFLLRDKANNFTEGFRGYLHANPLIKAAIDRYTTGTKVYSISKSNLKLVSIPKPSVDEQRAIVSALTDIDMLIQKTETLMIKKQNVKQAATQQLLTGKHRLDGFKKKWEKKRLGDLLTYERPDKYIVKSTEYFKRGHVPVLTANKSFILGYTNETFGVCTDVPTIVFDDFTTDSKYANFPFKVKSSAIKLLRPKHRGIDLKFMHERLRLIHVPIGDHRRYYISEYEDIEIHVPDGDEQSAIAAVLFDMDAEMEQLNNALEKYRVVKTGMLQQLLTGKIRIYGNK